ncbi:Uncharacterized protein OBRU01_12190 [Operophtera brumata]|uniref:Uncharacterized protein n=1 Tax=Operophtera brumata TaxID=104452 RepID=A0A0L7KXV3_OPEBR|nr:Uncharacterized protein OBRU01_12190 [Operophtera brumata]
MKKYRLTGNNLQMQMLENNYRLKIVGNNNKIKIEKNFGSVIMIGHERPADLSVSKLDNCHALSLIAVHFPRGPQTLRNETILTEPIDGEFEKLIGLLSRSGINNGGEVEQNTHIAVDTMTLENILPQLQSYICLLGNTHTKQPRFPQQVVKEMY